MSDAFASNPHQSETAEQLAYEQEILNRNFSAVSPPDEQSRDGPYGGDDGDAPLERGFGGSSRSGGSSGKARFGGLGSMVKDFAKNLKPNIMAAKSFISLESRITKDLYDPGRFPEVTQQAVVRRGLQLCPEELEYLTARRMYIRDRFAAYMGWDPAQIHPDDVPTIAFGGSGGGYRALLAVLGYAKAMKQSGLWDLLTYISGVSGSCWAIGAYFTFGQANVDKLIDHCKKRMSPHHPLSTDAIQKLLGSPGGDYETLGPLIQKQKAGLSTVAMDLYSVFTTGYFFLQEDPILRPGGSASMEVAGYHRAWWTWSSGKAYLRSGAEPLPILTAIRHERPWKDWVDDKHPFKEQDPTKDEHTNAANAWYQWYEMTPYEVGCDEIEAWCPTWAFGRRFEEGHSLQGMPEQSLALLLGLCTSAPAGPLSSYLSTIQRNLPAGIIGNFVNQMASSVAKMWGKHETEVFENHHPLHASIEHNFLYHYTKVANEEERPVGMERSPDIQLIDSGMDNNCPTYVMLHPERNVDVVINMDASSDVQKDTFPQRVQQIGSRRGLKFTKRHELKPAEDPANPDRFQGLYAQIYDGTLAPRPETVIDSYGHEVSNPPAAVVRRECTMVYMPLLPNERAVPGYDPSTAKFSGSYNLVWTPEQIDTIINCSMANVRDGEAAIKEALFNAWQRKKWMREQGVQQPPSQTQPQGQTQPPAQTGQWQAFPPPPPGAPPQTQQPQVFPPPPSGAPPQTQQPQVFPPPPPGQPPQTQQPQAFPPWQPPPGEQQIFPLPPPSFPPPPGQSQ